MSPVCALVLPTPGTSLDHIPPCPRAGDQGRPGSALKVSAELGPAGKGRHGQANNGGELVGELLKTIDGNVPVKLVHASHGKFVRAEPITSLYEQGRVHHVGTFCELEDQMAGFTADLDRATQGSPDRVDALVWGLTEVMLKRVVHRAGSVRYA